MEYSDKYLNFSNFAMYCFNIELLVKILSLCIIINFLDRVCQIYLSYRHMNYISIFV